MLSVFIVLFILSKFTNSFTRMSSLIVKHSHRTCFLGGLYAFHQLDRSITNGEFLELISSTARGKVMSSESDIFTLLHEIEKRYKSFDINMLCSCIWSLNNIPVKSENLQNILLKLIKSSLFDINEQGTCSSPKIITTFLTTFLHTKQKNSWYELHPSIQSFILEQSIDIVSSEKSQPYYIANYIWCLGKLNVKWKYLDNRFRSRLISNLLQNENLNIYVSKILYGLSLMDSRWTDICTSSDSDIAQLITRSIALNADKMNEHTIGNLVYALGKMGITWKKDLPTTAQKAILKAVSHVLPTMSEESISNLLWALGKCKVNWRYDISIRLKDRMIDQISRIGPINSRSLSSSVTGLWNMGLVWSSLYESHKDIIILSLNQLSESSSEQTVANIVYGLGKLEVNYHRDLPPKSQQKLFETIQLITTNFTAQGFANMFYGLVSMKVNWKEIPDSTQKAILSQAYALIPIMNEQSFSNLIWSFGQSGIQYNFNQNLNHDFNKNFNQNLNQKLYNDKNILSSPSTQSESLSYELLQRLLQRFEAICPNISAVALSQIVQGLFNMNVAWSDFSPSLHRAVSESLFNITPTIQIQSLSILMKSIIGMISLRSIVSSTSIPTSTWAVEDQIDGNKSVDSQSGHPLIIQNTDSTTSSVNEEIIHYDAVILSFFLSAMTRVFLTLSSLSVPTYGQPELKPQAVAVCLSSLGKSGICWIELSNNTKNAIEKGLFWAVPEASSWDISTTMHGLARLGLHWSRDLSHGIRVVLLDGIRRTISVMNEQEIGLTIWGITHLGLCWTEWPDDIRIEVTQRLISLKGKLDRPAVVAILQGLARNGDLSWQKHLTPDLQSVLLVSVKRTLANISTPSMPSSSSTPSLRLVSNLLHALGRLNAKWSTTLDKELKGLFLSVLVSCNGTTSINPSGSTINTSGSTSRIDDLICEDLSFTLNGLARLGVTWENLPSSVQSNLLTLLQILIRKMSRYEVASVYWSLGKMSCIFDSIPNTIKIELQFRFLREIMQMNSPEMTWTLWALGRMGMTWTEMPSVMQDLIPKAILSRLRQFTSEELVVVLWALVRVQTPINDFPLLLREELFTKIDFLAYRNIIS